MDNQYRIKLLSCALRDLDGIYAYIARTLSEPGTADRLLDMLEQGRDVILEIEVQGAMNVKKSFSDAVCIFVLPPSFEELRNRLISRNTEPEDVINRRIDRARQEVLLIDSYDYILINDDLDNAVEQFRSIVIAEGQKVNKNLNIIKEVCGIC